MKPEAWRRIHCATDYYSAFSIFRTCIVLSSRSAMSGESSVGVEVESRDGLDVESREGRDVSPLVGLGDEARDGLDVSLREGPDVEPVVCLGVEARDGEEDWHVEAVLRDGEDWPAKKRRVVLGVQPRVVLGEGGS